MKHYIDRDAIVAELEKRMQELHLTNTHQMQVGEKIDRDILMWLNALTWVKKILDTLEVKEVDLDKAYDDFLASRKKKGYMLFEVAKHFFELGLQARTDKELVEEVYSH